MHLIGSIYTLITNLKKAIEKVTFIETKRSRKKSETKNEQQPIVCSAFHANIFEIFKCIAIDCACLGIGKSETNMSSTKQPVVWCSDPNSTNQKPTAFALHGIQFEGMITEQHVLALRELINAAAEGRLLLPSNGAIVLLDCGMGVNANIGSKPLTDLNGAVRLLDTNIESAVLVAAATTAATSLSAEQTAELINVQTAEQQQYITAATVPIDIDTCDGPAIENEPIDKIKEIAPTNQCAPDNNTTFEPKYSEFKTPELSKYDFIYEFLCCAKCINKPSLNPNDISNELNAMHEANGLPTAKVCQRKVINCGHHDDIMFNIEKNMCHLSADCRRPSVPIYATVNTKLRKQNIFAKQNFNKNNRLRIDLHAQKMQSNAIEQADVETNNDNNRPECESFDKNDNCAVDLHVKSDNEIVMKQVPIDDEMPSAQNFIDGVNTDAQEIADNANNVRLRATSSSKNVSRKTSLDSSCTIGSMDSGFIEMQNKLELSAKEANQNIGGGGSGSGNDSNAKSTTENAKLSIDNGTPTIMVTTDEEILIDDSISMNPLEPSAKDNVLLKECSIQSRNRRKSYEEFKAIYHNRMTLESDLPFVQEHESTLSVCSKKEKIKARRKSYEEFKALVRECGDDTNESKRKKSKQHSKAKILSTMEEMMVYASPSSSPSPSETTTKCQTATESIDKNKCDALATTGRRPSSNQATPSSSSSSSPSKTKNDIYKTNFKIYDKLISYGTIYDIMQKKSDIYRAYRKYDAYMTYGTIYEILQRKSDDNELFGRTRATSEKCINKRINGTGCSDTGDKVAMPSATAKDDKNRSLNFGAIYDILQRKQRHSKKSNSLPNGICGAIEMNKLSDAESKLNRASDGCIYDIIQSKQCDSNNAKRTEQHQQQQQAQPHHRLSTPNVINNRFLVEKVNENELSHTKSNSDTVPAASPLSDEAKGNTYSELATEAMPSSNSTSFLAKWNSPRLSKVKKANRMRRFSHMLSYTHRQPNSDNNAVDVAAASASATAATVVANTTTTTKSMTILPCAESRPQTINENGDDKDETTNIDNCTANTESILESCVSGGPRKDSRVKKLQKLRKMSSPLPMSQITDLPPKIVPRKQSVQPPPLPPSFHLLIQQHNTAAAAAAVKCTDNFTSHNEHCAKAQSTDSTDDMHLNVNDSNNNNKTDTNNNSNSNSNIKNNSSWNEQDHRNDSDSVKGKVSAICDEKISKTKQKPTIKSTAISGNSVETKHSAKRSTVRDKKAKSRRLSEFTRGEFLNEKL